MIATDHGNIEAEPPFLPLKATDLAVKILASLGFAAATQEQRGTQSARPARPADSNREELFSEVSMSQLECPSCKLRIAALGAPSDCPRCRIRWGVRVELVPATLPPLNGTEAVPEPAN